MSIFESYSNTERVLNIPLGYNFKCMCMNSCRLCSESNWELGVSYYSMKKLVFSVLGTIPLNFPKWYYALANEICTCESVTFVLELFYTGK